MKFIKIIQDDLPPTSNFYNKELYNDRNHKTNFIHVVIKLHILPPNIDFEYSL